ncbi:hypothetical protein CCM_06234 [Cordyceps militaris CM01]|uniref:Extracellular matrix protein n=1 Tax=Cordyceps militaris (strain CM01) TaxID=983644 RepID=G3JJI6_CORMM|nr:uncharacterized protein CCM_06234 [Cordyceps militaris CM01]EGX92074.1 hypothetical protein CCM_06234 [Cordyceps militaris CM01]
MKLTAATIAAALAIGALAQPRFTNTVINPSEGKPFTLTFDGCTGGCTITLQTGPNSLALADIRTLTSDATESFDVTLDNLPSGTYNFKITNNSDGSEPNYSTPFTYQGTGPTSSDSSSSSLPTSSASSGSSTDSISTSSSSESSNTSSATSSSDSSSSTDSTTSTGSSSTGSSTSTQSSRPSSTTSSQPSATSPPSAGSVAGFSPLGLVGAAAAALFL